MPSSFPPSKHGKKDLMSMWNILLRKLSELVEAKSVLRDHIPIIRRFTGGGTVIVDNGTIFVTLICNKDAVPNVQPFPRPIMSWSGLLYSKVFEGIADFQLRENDYAFGDRKFGGNAQSITKNRWIHHTSFLWDYEVKNMSYLKLPAKAPKYRLTSSSNSNSVKIFASFVYRSMLTF
ncbi:lipoate-protein ligase A-like protein [Trifolium pratense]|uniref:Lipoate-protein ligase A-like protein n=1 Tax=Trifolium pratense TaxID=57577 RepID=A0A2K3LFG3_TRIPR|nr:lipoate-protein ligase A-like protein [Trifolium pratense]